MQSNLTRTRRAVRSLSMQKKQKYEHGPEEIAALKLLRSAQRLLAKAINSMGRKTVAGGEPQFVAWMAVFVNMAADGYLLLRKRYRVSASKLLVRPPLEAVFKTLAVLKQPAILFRLAHDQTKKEKKLLATTPEGEAQAKKMLQEVEEAFRKARPNITINKAKLW